MKVVNIIDEDGFKRRYQLQDEDKKEDAAEVGLYVGVPDLSELDWDDIMRDIHNKLHDMGLFTLDDIYRQQTGMGNALGAVIKKQIKSLYKE